MLRKSIMILRTEGVKCLLRMGVQYLQWVVEYHLFATVVEYYVLSRGGEITRDGVVVDVNNNIISKQTIYRIITGRYEREERQFINQYVSPNHDVIELGGGIGITACHTNKLLSNTVDHIVLEANQKLIPTIERNKERNSCVFSIENKAYHPSLNSVRFSADESFESGQIIDDTVCGHDVQAVSLEQIRETYNIDEFTLIADIEGAEFDLIEEEIDMLSEHCQMIIIEIHPSEKNDIKQAKVKLQKYNYQIIDGSGDVFVFKKDKLTR